MMRRWLPIAIIVLLLAPLPAPAGNRLVATGVRTAVAQSLLTVVPDRDWNRLGRRPGSNAERWTLDGPQLNALNFYGGIADDRPLFRDRDHRNSPLPHFAATMLPTDITALFENSYRVAIGTSLMTIDSSAPTVFAGAAGLRFTYHFVVQGEEIERQGIGEAAVIDKKLYMITFEAPSLHYFAAGLPSYHRIAASARRAPLR